MHTGSAPIGQTGSRIQGQYTFSLFKPTRGGKSLGQRGELSLERPAPCLEWKAPRRSSTPGKRRATLRAPRRSRGRSRRAPPPPPRTAHPRRRLHRRRRRWPARRRWALLLPPLPRLPRRRVQRRCPRPHQLPPLQTLRWPLLSPRCVVPAHAAAKRLTRQLAPPP